MRPFEYIRPTFLAEATAFLGDHADECLPVAGGTAAVVLMNMGVLRPPYVLDLGGIDELRGMEWRDGTARLGGLTTIRTLEVDATVRERAPILAEAASQVASVRIRNLATVGGAVSYGEPQTDTPAALLALGASVTLASSRGGRSLDLRDFFVAPYETAREPDELLTAVDVPLPGPGAGGCHVKFTVGSPENKPVANVSALLALDASGVCADARVVVGAVGPVPAVVDDAASLLVGERPGDALIAEVAARAAGQVEPLDDLRGPAWYKRRITKTLVERALRCALQRAQANRSAA